MPNKSNLKCYFGCTVDALPEGHSSSIEPQQVATTSTYCSPTASTLPATNLDIISNMMFKTRKSSKKPKQSFLKDVVRCCSDFCLETSMHGFNHVAEPRRHWTERLLWVCILCISVWGMAEISLEQLQRYRDNPTVVTLEKDFRTWNFNLPGVTACFVDRVDRKKLVEAIKSRWNVTPEDQQFEYYRRFVTTVANSDLFHLQGYREFAEDNNLNVDLKELVIDVMVEQQLKIFSSLTVNPKLVPVMTEAGICYVTNSLAITDIALNKSSINSTGLPYTCKYSSMTCWIMFEVTTNSVDFYVHSPYDIADMTSTPSRIYLALIRVTELQVIETRAGTGVRTLSPRRRRCLYTDEPTDTTRQVYSTITCRLTCRSRLALQLCGCVPFYYLNDVGPACRPAGMLCLAELAAKMASVQCICGQQCVDAVYRELATDEQIWSNTVVFESKGSVRFAVQAPRARYTREIVFHFQDLVVSFGGAAGLFLGASFISFVEILFFVIHRCLGLFRVVEHEQPMVIKKSRTAFEETRIQEINSILAGAPSSVDSNKNY